MVENLQQYVGKRIEIPVHYNAWARGARFGVVTAWRRGGADRSRQTDYISVKLDAIPNKRLKIWRMDIEYAKFS